MGTGISGKSKQPRESQSKRKQIPMGTGISGEFKKNMKSEPYIAHSGTFNPKRQIPNATSQWHSVDRQSSRDIRNFNDTLRTVAHSGTFDTESRIVNVISKILFIVYRLGESGFCYSPQRARALASTFP